MTIAEPLQRPGSYWPSRLPLRLVVPSTTLWFNLEVSARRYPDKALYLYFGRSFSFGEVHAAAERLAGWLQQAGVRAGDRVGLCLQNCPQYAIAFYAALRADAVVVPINPMNRAEELRHCFADAGIRLVVCAADIAAAVGAAIAALPAGERPLSSVVARYADAMPDEREIAADELPTQAMLDWLRADLPLPDPGLGTRWYRWTDVVATEAVPGPHTRSADDLAILPYTSGTTGQPKGCMHSHRTLMHNAVGAGVWSGSGAEAVILGVVPLFHITGMIYGLHAPVYSGATVVLMPRWDRELAGRLIERHRISHWTCIPTMIIDLLASPNCARFDLSSLRHLSGGGAAMPQAVAERLQRDFGLTFAEGYGLTETAAPTHANPPERAKLQCLGIPIFGVDSRIVDPTTLRELPVGEVGEIVTHGPMVFDGYWRHPQATRDAFIDIDGRRFFRTGDLGRVDSEGYFFITDRLKRMINASGYKVWPAEVETLLFRHPAIHEACVVSARDPYRGETVKAVVVLRDEAKSCTTTLDIIAWSRENMALYKVPREVEFVDSLPKSAAGKVMWRLLQERQSD